jgi:hypothetical protein
MAVTEESETELIESGAFLKTGRFLYHDEDKSEPKLRCELLPRCHWVFI